MMWPGVDLSSNESAVNRHRSPLLCFHPCPVLRDVHNHLLWARKAQYQTVIGDGEKGDDGNTDQRMEGDGDSGGYTRVSHHLLLDVHRRWGGHGLKCIATLL